MTDDRRKKMAETVAQERTNLKNAKDSINGNPEVVAALEAQEARLEAIEEYLNLDTEVDT